VFVRIVTELEICHIYEAILRTIKIAACNLSGASNFKHNTVKIRRMDITLFILKIDLISSRFSQSSSQVSNDKTSTVCICMLAFT
jgi:hypothetical protein